MTSNEIVEIIFKNNKTPNTEAETQRCNSLLEKTRIDILAIAAIVAWGGQTDSREKLWLFSSRFWKPDVFII